MGLRWRMFVAWGAAGAMLALGISAVGVFTVPPAALLLIVLALRAPREVVGLMAGIGTTVAVIGAINLDYRPCARIEVLPPGTTDYECGGFDGTPWLVVGLALIAAAVLLFLAQRRGRSVHGRH